MLLLRMRNAERTVGPQLNFLLVQATIINCLGACQVLFKQEVPILWEKHRFFPAVFPASSWSLLTARLQEVFLISEPFPTM